MGGSKDPGIEGTRVPGSEGAASPGRCPPSLKLRRDKGAVGRYSWQVAAAASRGRGGLPTLKLRQASEGALRGARPASAWAMAGEGASLRQGYGKAKRGGHFVRLGGSWQIQLAVGSPKDLGINGVDHVNSSEF